MTKWRPMKMRFPWLVSQQMRELIVAAQVNALFSKLVDFERIKKFIH